MLRFYRAGEYLVKGAESRSLHTSDVLTSLRRPGLPQRPSGVATTCRRCCPPVCVDRNDTERSSDHLCSPAGRSLCQAEPWGPQPRLFTAICRSPVLLPRASCSPGPPPPQVSRSPRLMIPETTGYSPGVIKLTPKMIIQDTVVKAEIFFFLEQEICLLIRGNSHVGSSMEVKLKLTIFLIL